MCGIAGIIYRHPDLYKNLGTDLLKLIQPLESRGPDSCGVGLYGNQAPPHPLKILLFAEQEMSWEAVRNWLDQQVNVFKFEAVGKGRRVSLQGAANYSLEAIKAELAIAFPDVHLMSMGYWLEIYKEVGSAENLFQTYDLNGFMGSHGIAHTRMATESVVDTDHSHPFTATPDLSIVHNGQISNYYKLRFALERQGAVFETHNDSEAIAHYLHYQLLQGKTLENSLHALLKDLDGTYTILIATADKVALVRDKYAAKPAVIYESPEMVAVASEYRCFLNLPKFDPTATIREPDAAEINIWSITPKQSTQSLEKSKSIELKASR